MAFCVDRATGKLSFTGHYTAVGNPSFIAFLDLAKADGNGPADSRS
jgi:6-phosphogluconolactonase